MIKLVFEKDRYKWPIELTRNGDPEEAIEEIYHFMSRFYPAWTSLNGTCNVKFISAVEMHKFEKNDAEEQVAWIESCLELIRKIKEELGSAENRGVGYLLELLEQIEFMLRRPHEEFKSFSELKHIIIKLEGWLKEAEYPFDSSIYEDMTLLIESLRKIRLPMRYLGCYVHRERTIYLCMENIENSAQAPLMVRTLTVAVLVHEYTHCLHIHFIKDHRTGSKTETVLCKNGVLETVAEYVQFHYAKAIKDQPLIDWMKNHTESGLFPGWAYAGGGIVMDYEDSTRTHVFKKLLAISRLDWQRAYYLIESIDLLNRC